MKKDGRLQLRLPLSLKKKAQAYAARHHTDISALVIRFLTRLLEEEEKKKNPVDAEQV